MASERRDYRTNRLEAFSDGVFAIAITLLVLELSVPMVDEQDLLRALADEWASYLAYVVSFSTVGLVWLSHTTITEYLVRADYPFIRLNLFLLLVVSFIPFPTKVLSAYIGEDDAERVAVTLYGLTLLVASLTVALLWRYAVSHRLVSPDTSDEEVHALTGRIVPSLTSYAFFLAVGFFLPAVAVVGYLVIALSFIFPVARVFRRRRAERPS